MSNTRILKVAFDGEMHPVKLRGRHWLPKLLGYGGVSVGLTVFLRPDTLSAHPALVGHELVHTLDFVRRRRRVWRGWYWLSVGVDLAAYAWSWLRVGCRYHRIPEEITAYNEQYLVAYDNHPAIRIVRDA
jgi:hypothetical protein